MFVLFVYSVQLSLSSIRQYNNNNEKLSDNNVSFYDIKPYDFIFCVGDDQSDELMFQELEKNDEENSLLQLGLTFSPINFLNP